MVISANISTGYPVPTTHNGYSGPTHESGESSSEKPVNTEISIETTEKQGELTDEEKQQVQKLEARDREVRAHEMAHKAAGGQYVRGGNYEYQTGPDGKRYAVGGEVSIDTSAVSGDPEATVRKMQVVRKAALAPAQPSAQDRAVAAHASQKEVQARAEIREEAVAEQNEKNPQNESSKSNNPFQTTTYSKQGIRVPFLDTTLSQNCDMCA